MRASACRLLRRGAAPRESRRAVLAARGLAASPLQPAPALTALPAHLTSVPARAFSARPWGPGTPVQMPALSPTMTSGRVAKWNKKEGDKIASGDVLGEIETDKASVDFVFQDDAILARILVKEGEEAKVGSIVAIVVEDAADVAAVQALDLSSVASASSAAAAAPPAAPAPAAPAPSSSSAASSSTASSSHVELGNHQVMPSARLLMANEGVKASSLLGKGTGKDGRVTKGDVLAFLGRIPQSALSSATAPAKAAPQAAPAVSAASVSAEAASAAAAAVPASQGGWAHGFQPPKEPNVTELTSKMTSLLGAVVSDPAAVRGALPTTTWTDTKPSQIRRVIAQRLTESKAGVPHSYCQMDIELDSLLSLRNTLKQAGVVVSVNDMVVKAAAKALKDVPEANCYYDKKTDSIKQQPGVDVCVAVATEGGLITPIVRGADSMGLSAINEKVKELATRARANKLKPEEFQGGSFTISNLGMFGSISSFTAVINPPQAAILAVGKGEKRVLGGAFTAEESEALGVKSPASAGAGSSEPRVAEVMTVQLSADARVLEPHVAASFLQVLKHYIQNPALLVA